MIDDGRKKMEDGRWKMEERRERFMLSCTRTLKR
jgi:hypothetical protein